MKNLLAEIEELEIICKNFLHEEEKEEDERDLTLQLKSFNQIVTDCKFELLKVTPEHVDYVLSSLYKFDLTSANEEQIDKQLDCFIASILEKNELGTSEEKIEFLRDMKTNIKQTIEHIDFEYTHIITEAKMPLFFYRRKLRVLEKEKLKLSELKKAVASKLEYLANLLAKNLIDNFYTFYIFISFLLYVKKVAQSELLVIKIVSIIDRYIDIIAPAFNNRSLQHKDMIYHYAVFELKDLKVKALKLFG